MIIIIIIFHEVLCGLKENDKTTDPVPLKVNLGNLLIIKLAGYTLKTANICLCFLSNDSLIQRKVNNEKNVVSCSPNYQ